jgi:hypothetical protein
MDMVSAVYPTIASRETAQAEEIYPPDSVVPPSQGPSPMGKEIGKKFNG